MICMWTEPLCMNLQSQVEVLFFYLEVRAVLEGPDAWVHDPEKQKGGLLVHCSHKCEFFHDGTLERRVLWS